MDPRPLTGEKYATKPLLDKDGYFLDQKEPGLRDGVVGVPVYATGHPVAYSPETGRLNPDAALQTSLDLPTAEWKTGLFCCINVSGDKSMPRDCEICCLGSSAPCVLYGGITQQLYDDESKFRTPCFQYVGLYTLGHILCRYNALAPLLSFSKRIEIRKRFGIKGHMTKFSQATGCCANSPHMEKCDTCCDCLLHYFCHPCALCQEARELERQFPKSGAKPATSTTAPSFQEMGR